MLIDLSRMLDGTVDTIPFEIEFEAGFIDDIPDFDFDRPFTVTGKVTDSAGYMSLNADAEIPYRTSCARCLKALEGSCKITISKTVAERKSLANADAGEIEDNYILIENGMLSLDDAVFEQLYMNLPSRVLCREDCRGICQYCGIDLNEEQCGCEEEHKKTVNPSFAALSKLFEDGEGED